MSETDNNSIDYTQKWWVMASVGMGIFLATIDGSIVNIALPSLVRAFHSDFQTVQWVVLSYLLTVSTLMLSFGRLADMYGKKRIYNIGFVVFTAGSALCGLSPNVYALIIFRIFQGVGAAMIMALGTAIVTEAFPSKERGRALGIAGSIVSVGIVLGPTLGGLLLDSFTWHWIFFVNVPIGIIGTFMVARYVPDIRPTGRQRFDYIGAGTLLISLLGLLMALTLGQSLGFGSAIVLTLLVVFIVFLVVFIRIELQVEQPMVDLRLFRDRQFSVSLGTGYMAFIALAGTIILMPFYLEDVLGYPPRQVGLLLAVVPVGLGLVAPISGSLSDRYGTRPITVVGLALMVLGYLGVSSLGPDTTALGYVLRFIPIGIGIGTFQSPNNSAIMGAAPRSRLGIASGMLAITRTLGQVTGIAVLGAVWAGRVFVHAGKILPGGATTASPLAQVTALRDTFVFVAILISIGLAIGAWGWYDKRKAHFSQLSQE